MTLAPVIAHHSWRQLFDNRRKYPGLLHLDATPTSVSRVTAGLVYLATPYTGQVIDPMTLRWRADWSRVMARLAAIAAADLAQAGITAASPIVLSEAMCHEVEDLDPLDERFWSRWCAPLLAACRAVVVPSIFGWHESLGVWREVTWAIEHNMPVHVYGRPAP